MSEIQKQIDFHVDEIITHASALAAMAGINDVLTCLAENPDILTRPTCPTRPISPASLPEKISTRVSEMPDASLSQQVCAVLSDLNLTQTQLAKLMHVNPARVCEAVNGKARESFKVAWIRLSGPQARRRQAERDSTSSLIPHTSSSLLKRFRAAVKKIGSTAVAERLGIKPEIVKSVFSKGSAAGIADKVLKKFAEVYHG